LTGEAAEVDFEVADEDDDDDVDFVNRLCATMSSIFYIENHLNRNVGLTSQSKPA